MPCGSVAVLGLPQIEYEGGPLLRAQKHERVQDRKLVEDYEIGLQRPVLAPEGPEPG